MTQNLIRHTKILSIVGDIMKASVPASTATSGPATRLYDLALVKDPSGLQSMAQVISIDRDQVSLQAFSGTKRIY